MIFSKKSLKIHPEIEVATICNELKNILRTRLKRRGLIVALSGGIDSSVTTALAAKALGPHKVVVLLMPEKQSADDTLELSRNVAEQFGVHALHEDITDILSAFGFYSRYDNAVRMVIPEYGNGWKSKISISNALDKKGFNFYNLVVQTPEKEIISKRLPLKAYLEIIAATNFKQRIRKTFEYYHADRLNYAVAGTPNRLEYDQGFFVKLGDGAADVKPIAHLYKSQVYQLAEFLDVPKQILTRPPTTDTYSLAQGQDEFYFSLPYQKMDLCLYGKNNNIPTEVVGKVINLTPDQVQLVYNDIDTKRSTTRYLHLSGLLVKPVPEIQ